MRLFWIAQDSEQYFYLLYFFEFYDVRTVDQHTL